MRLMPLMLLNEAIYHHLWEFPVKHSPDQNSNDDLACDTASGSALSVSV